MDIYCNSCLGCVKLAGFQEAKTSANKRLLFIYHKDLNHFAWCKGTTFFENLQML